MADQSANISDKLKCLETKVPTIASPWDVLVKVHATSINPLDVRMCYGYGRRILELLDAFTNFEPKITNDRYPLTLGRDFSGEVVTCGPCARNTYKPGDMVFGAVEPQRSGAHAQYLSVPSYCLTKKPENLSHKEAASIPFVALTAYSALCTFGHLTRDQCHNKQVLVIGGSGGVGSFAIQLLKLWGASVYATCSSEKIEWLEGELFVDRALSYNEPLELETINGKFDFVLDCGNYEGQTYRSHQDIVKDSLKYLKPFGQSVYVTLSPPILSNTDQHGLVLGTAGTLFQAALDTFSGLQNLNSARWAVFLPNKNALDYIANLYADEAITPQVSSVFGFSQVPDAFENLQAGRPRGKVVVDVTAKRLEIPETAKSSSKESHSSDHCKEKTQ